MTDTLGQIPAAVPERTIEFGWFGDGGVGDRLVQQIIRGEKWATCGFRRAYTPEELEEVASGVGELHGVRSAEDPTIRAIIRVTHAFETTYGSPDPRLVEGEGDGEDVAAFQRDHEIAWRADFPDEPLSADEILAVELFELVSAVD